MEGAKIGLMFCVETENAGAPRDMDIMDRFYRKFGFEGEIIRQPSKEFMLRSLQNLANYSPKPVSCILIAFSGHGDEKVGEWNESELVTADHQRVKVSSITSIFSETNCPRLKGVPKIFITDACRGSKSSSSSHSASQSQPFVLVEGGVVLASRDWSYLTYSLKIENSC
uniref:Caspase family p20 domain-containing protein n=1 Tax=Astyanax mexicanus TaxID=7994 RepID=A0A3B1K2A6_ASTMX